MPKTNLPIKNKLALNHCITRKAVNDLLVKYRFFYFFTILESDTLPIKGFLDLLCVSPPKYFFKNSFIIIKMFNSYIYIIFRENDYPNKK